ncbi:signal peptidase I [Peribacillus butanolivorans]|uniref:signal peptidase I n=1 Tax=Peribacillus butanolivorans TaxID=421767 RepID=UPI0035D66A12
MQKDIKSEVFSWVKSILFALIIVFICNQFLFTPVIVKGKSMEPTYENNNRIVVTKIGKIEHFDMVVFHAPDADKKYIKRVIGLPGDSVEMKKDVLYINGKKYTEPYLKTKKEEIPPEENLTENFTLQNLLGKSKVPNGYLFVMGDNRRDSWDGRRFGFISEESLVGKVEFRFYPLNELGMPQ